MIICPKCHKEQSMSNFCGYCGEPFESTNTNEPIQEEVLTADPGIQQAVKNSETKEKINSYFTYFKESLLKPSSKTSEKNFKFAVVNIAIIMCLISFLPGFVVPEQSFTTLRFFIQVLLTTMLSTGLIMGVTAFFTIKFGTIRNWRHFTSIFGAYNTVAIVIFIALYFCILMNLNKAGVILYIASILIIFFLIPFYILLSSFAKETKERFFHYLSSITALLVVYYFLTRYIIFKPFLISFDLRDETNPLLYILTGLLEELEYFF